MDILSVSIRNCLTIGQADLQLDNRGLLLVQGENTDDSSASSNGAGKSSLLDALCWALYGETARGVSGDDVVNETAKKDCSVIVMLDDGGVIYKIERFRKHKTYKNQLFAWQLDSGLTGPSTALSKGTDKETQIVVEKIMGCSLEVFVGAIYAGQEKMPDLPGMTDKQLKMIVEEAAGVQELSEAYQEARRRSLVVESEHKSAISHLCALTSRLTMVDAELMHAESQHKFFEDGRKQRAKDELAKATPVLEQARVANEAAGKFNEAALRKRKLELEVRLSSHRAQEDELAKLQGVLTAVGRQATAAATQTKAVKTRLEHMERDLAAIDSQVGKPCGECGKNYCEHDLAAARESRLKKIAECKVELMTEARAYKTKNDALEAATAELTAFKGAMTDVSATSAELTCINNDLTNLAHLRNEATSGGELAAKIREGAKSKLAEMNPWTRAVESKKADLDKVKKEITVTEARVAELEIKAEIANDCVKVFGPAGVRAHILDTVTPFLNEKTSEYLGALTDGNIHAAWSTLSKTAKGELKEKFNIDVTNDKGGKSFKALSGGEKRKVRIASAMALQDMVASRATKPINLFMADEIDHALDEPGLERLMSVLDSKAKERGTVLVVSHSDLSDWIDTVITVTKSGGISTVSGATRRGF